MTDEQTQAIEEVSARETRDNANTGAMSDEQIAEIAKNFQASKALPTNADAPSSETPEGGDVAEEGAAEEAVDGLPPEETEEPQQAAPAKKKRREFVPKERIEEANRKAEEKLRLAEQRAMAAEEKNTKLISFFEKTIGKENELPQQEEEAEEAIDAAHINPLKSEVKAIKEELLETKFESSVSAAEVAAAAKLPEYNTAVRFLIAARASEHVAREEAMGKEATDEIMAEACAKAYAELRRDSKDMYLKGGAAAVPGYLYRRAAALGFSPAQVKTVAANGTGVNMAAVDKARREAGAPTYKKESVQIASGGDWKEIVRNMAKKDGRVTDSYLRSQGVS